MICFVFRHFVTDNKIARKEKGKSTEVYIELNRAVGFRLHILRCESAHKMRPSKMENKITKNSFACRALSST